MNRFIYWLLFITLWNITSYFNKRNEEDSSRFIDELITTIICSGVVLLLNNYLWTR